MAAGRTVEHGRVHSLHSYFLRPGDPKVPILYEVDRIRDGRSFTTRRVVAVQHGRAIFNLSASFHDLEVGLEHQIPMPEVPEPESLAPLFERLQPWKEELKEWFDRPHPDRPAPHRRPPVASEGGRASPISASGSGPTASCPTTRSCTPASRPTPRTCRSSTPSSPRTRPAGTTRTSWAPASTTACGSTSPSGPTNGCCTTPTRRSPPRGGAWLAASCSTGRDASASRSLRRGWSACARRTGDVATQIQRFAIGV